MITEWVLGAGGSLLSWIFGALPVVAVPSWLSSGSGAMSTVFQAAGSMGVWFPTGLLVTVLTAVLVMWLVGFVVKVTRMVLSLFTAGGGSAA